ncbi:MAG: hypothetical protein ACE5HE_13480 [Phycisphaerae bacterium]
MTAKKVKRITVEYDDGSTVTLSDAAACDLQCDLGVRDTIHDWMLTGEALPPYRTFERHPLEDRWTLSAEGFGAPVAG